MVKINITKNIVDKAINDTFTTQSKPGEVTQDKITKFLFKIFNKLSRGVKLWLLK